MSTPAIPCAGGCGETRPRWGKSGMCRSCGARERMKALHADPEFAAANRERMKALNADPEFAAAHRERNRARMKALNASGAMMSDHTCAVGGCGARLAKSNRSGVCSACRWAGAAAVVEAAQ